MKIKVDPEFAAFIPPLRDEERAQLEGNLIAEGCRDPLVVWEEKSILLDGHNRLEICKAHKLPFETVVVSLPDREAAADWIDANQLGRRNLTPDHYRLLRGRRYNRLKHTKAEAGAMKGSIPQNEGSSHVAEKLADQYGVSRATIERDGQFAAALEALKAVDPEIEIKVLQGTAPSRAAILKAAKALKDAEAEAEEAASAASIDDPEPPPDPRPAARRRAATVLDSNGKPTPDEADRRAKTWLKTFKALIRDINLVVRSLPRRDFARGLTARWSKPRRDMLRANLKDLREVVDRCLSDLEDMP